MDLSKLIYLSTQQQHLLASTKSVAVSPSPTTPPRHSPVITPSSPSSEKPAQPEPKTEESTTGIDLSLSGVHQRRSEQLSAEVAGHHSPLPSSSASHLEHVLQRYQQAATMTLNGPDWFSFRRSIVADSPAAAAASEAILELSKGARTSESSTLDLRTPTRREVPPSATSTQSSKDAAPAPSQSFSSFLSHPPPFPIQQPPLLTPPDQDNCERSETQIAGESIACFSIGGEKRLCFPQIINIVLEGFEYPAILEALKELQIYLATCSPEQMDVLKRFGDIPLIAPSCGLITKTDAHRLCSTLLGSAPPPKLDFSRLPVIPIYHECFGRTTGLYAPGLYISETALCIQCDECSGAFSPSTFVSHTHRSRPEHRTCHWGFDPANWRHYILPLDDCTYEDRVTANPDLVPLCSGGRKAFKASLKAAAASLSSAQVAKIEGAYNNKSVVAVRKVLKEMKNLFNTNGGSAAHRRTHSLSSTSTAAALAAKRKLDNVKESTSESTSATRLYRSASDSMQLQAASKRFKSSASESEVALAAAAFSHQLGASFSGLLPFLNGTAAAQATPTSAPEAARAPPPPPPQYSSHLLANLLSGSAAANAPVSAPPTSVPPTSHAPSTDTASAALSLFKSSPLSLLFASDPKTASSTFTSLLKDPNALAVLAQPGASLAYPQLFFAATEQSYRNQLETAAAEHRANGLESILEQTNRDVKSAATDFPMIYEHLTKAASATEKTGSILNGTVHSSATYSKGGNSQQPTPPAASHALAVDSLLNYASTKGRTSGGIPASTPLLPKLETPFETAKSDSLKYPSLGSFPPSILSESFIKKTQLDGPADIKPDVKQSAAATREPSPKVPFAQLEEDVVKSLIEDHVEKLKHRLTDVKLTTLRDHLLTVDKLCSDEISTLANRQTSTFKTKLFLTLFQLIDLLVLDSKEPSSTAPSHAPASPNSRRLSTESKGSTEDEIIVDDDSNDSIPTPVIVKMEQETGIVRLENSTSGSGGSPRSPKRETTTSPRQQSSPSARVPTASPIPMSPASLRSGGTNGSTAGGGQGAAAIAISSASSSSSSSGANSPAPPTSNAPSHQEYMQAIMSTISTLTSKSTSQSCSPLHHLGGVLGVAGRDGGSGGPEAKLLLTTGSPN